MELKDVATQRYDIGRAAIFVHGTEANGLITPTAWDPSDPLFSSMIHIGNTEGAIDIAMNPEYSELTLPETSGPAAIRRFLTGEKPSFTIGIFPTPNGMKLFSPTGKGSAGQMRRRRVRERLLWIVPEEVFLAEDANGNVVEVPLTYAGGQFLKDGDPVSDEEQELLDMSLLCWRCDFQRATPVYRHEDGGKSLREVEVMLQQDFTRPDGCQLFLMLEEAADFGVDFEGS
jgi:hypothetical protein